MSIRDELYAYASGMKTISTHSHHNYHEYFENMDLRKLLTITYPGGFGAGQALQKLEGEEFWRKYFTIMACRQDARWLSLALGEVYLDGEPMSLENYRQVDAHMQETYARDPYFHEKIITDICNIETLILDEHRDPGMTHDLPFVRPAMRMDWALTASEPARALLGELPEDFDEYLKKVDAFIDERVRRYGVVAFKLASAYERPLDFKKVSYADAERAYRTDKNRDLGDFMVYHTCELARAYGLPYQFHTGLGQLKGTAAMNLEGLIRDFPEVKFVLLHCSFPWSADSLALAYSFTNVYIDLAWIFTLSDSMGKRYLREALDMVSLDRFAWGCDTWSAEEGYGALLAVRSALAEEFARRVSEGQMDMDCAKGCIRMILYENPKALYGL